MSLLVEIATRADVPLEAVVRVLTREPVADDAKARVLAVLDDLDAEQTRVLQRFALAAVHDELPRPAEDVVVAEYEEGPLELPEAVVLETAPAVRASPAPVEAAPAVDQAPLVQLGAVLGELAEAVRELRRETDAERRERVDDLAVLIDLITKGWEGLDRRLGRVERQLGRLEAPAEPRPRVLPPVEPPPVPPPPDPPPPPDSEGRPVLRGRLPLVAALLLGVGVGAVAALDLPSRSDVSSLVSASTNERPAATPQTVPSTSSVLGEIVTDPVRTTTQAKRPAPPASPKRAPTTTAARPTTSAAKPTATAAKPTTTAAPSTGFQPSRNWAWPPAEGADYYLVEFFRDGTRIHAARPTAARLTLPDSVVFTPGSYRWRVRPGNGDPAANDLEPAIVDSGFTVSR
jgi:hypothetical protein